MKLVKPNIEYKNQVIEYKKEFLDYKENLAGASYLQEYDSYEQWLEFLKDNEEESTKHTEVTADEFLLIRENDNRVIGMINIRHALNGYLYNYGGHIGYSVKKSERRKGYAKEMLKMALQHCIKFKMDKVLLTCDANNIASERTIKACGGVLENEVLNGGTLVKRYWIKL
ncbi:GNAT family N-acetyltransferase [Clostridium felsineum]|uniref:GNAT family N-acetyltransferase n=1 Tax=Clostridium felsineum TaxID=36839 RepID=UPI00098C8D7A|nr:GNAT family N-acetyltransferase [Clostridium felsineum]MCR3760910.1 GNAT family N-acetyltransferase [Clostridium felsineum]URZ17076.1 hypothetical protein CLFE_031280 [Clostridium felsineum DSM 794]